MNTFTDFDLKLLRVFKAVTDCGGLSVAESALNINLSTISTYISDLELRLGFKLCNRGRSGFQLTPEGRLLYQNLDNLLMSIEEFRIEVGKIKNRISGELSIGVVDNTLSDDRLKLPEAIQAVKERASDLFIKLEIKSTHEIETALLGRSLNIGIGPFRKQHPQLIYETLYEDTLNLYFSSKHALFESEGPLLDIPVERMGGLDYVSRGYLREAKMHDYMEYFKVAATVHNMEAVAALILSGRFVGYLPAHYAQQWVGTGHMHVIKPAFFSQQVQFCSVRRKDTEVSSAAQAFLAAIRSTLS